MSLFYLVRHGETDWNRERVFRGRLDIALNDRGHQQAQAVAWRLALRQAQGPEQRRGAEVGLRAVYSSPLARAQETARAIAEHCGVQVELEEGLIDMDFGDWEGLTEEEVQARFPEVYQAWQEKPQSVSIPGAESLAQVRERACSALRRLAGRHPDSALCVVSHRVVSKLLMCWALGLEESAFWRIRQDTGCINIFEYAGLNPVVHTLNDTCHLSGLGAGGKQADF